MHKASEIIAPLLKTVSGDFVTVYPARKIIAPNLKSVGGDFLASSVEDLQVSELRSVGGNLNTTRAEGFYRPNIHVAGEWTTCPGAVEDWKLQQAARMAIRCDCDIEI